MNRNVDLEFRYEVISRYVCVDNDTLAAGLRKAGLTLTPREARRLAAWLGFRLYVDSTCYVPAA